jgi:hypothetical protein
MKRTLLSMILWSLTVGLGSLHAGSFEAFSNSGVLDVDNVTYLQGDVFQGSGDLVQLIWVGPDGEVDPADSLGNPTDDDSLLGTTYIGMGYPFNPNEGKFDQIFTHDLLVAGTMVYMRAWNDSVVTAEQRAAYGHSQVYTLVNDFDSHDFGTWYTGVEINTPVELVSFSAIAGPGVVELRWTTHSETENLGFYVYRSETASGLRKRLNERMIAGAITSQTRHDYAFKDEDIKDQRAYFYWLTDVAVNGATVTHGPVMAIGTAKPDNYELAQNFPNPFNPSTTITYSLKDTGPVRLFIYNIRGQLIRELVNAEQTAGHYTLEWDGRDQNSVPVPSGTYIYMIEANDFKAARRMTMAK